MADAHLEKGLEGPAEASKTTPLAVPDGDPQTWLRTTGALIPLFFSFG